ncbi:MAG: hypothetical protein HC939_21785 [Pleurocapsa sp. SU_5_0]|nr:hypothetical protein [Pleurocapsa sp. SU_5_0]NJO98029.1 hypothetical protein [Pleurocapsa sp. CRU_1_2]
MAKVNHNQSVPKVRSVDELLAAKRANNQLGRNKATETIKKTSDVLRNDTGKATRAELQNDLVKSAELAQAQGEEDGIKQFLTEDIPAVVRALQGELKTKHQEVLANNEINWFSMFNSPVSLQWLTKNTEKILKKCDINHKYYDWVNSKIEHIKDVWSEIDPQQALPDIKRYWQVYNFEVPESVKEFLVKQSGN